MRAITARSYGTADVVAVEDVPDPVPKAGEVRIRNHATVVSRAEAIARSGSDTAARLFFGLTRPRLPILGTTFAGEIESVGTGVTRFRVGDPVMGFTGPTFGAHAELVCVAEDGVIVSRQADLASAHAAAVLDESLTALPFLRDVAHLRAEQSILINGASGAVGSAAVQLAAHFGARVTAVCSAANAELVLSLGADEVIDYGAEDFTSDAHDRRYDMVFDAIGGSSYIRCRRLLVPGGIYMTTVPSGAILPQMLWTRLFGRTRAAIAFTGLRKTSAVKADAEFIAGLVAAGEFVPVIDSVFPMEDAAAAHARVDTGHKRGSVVVTLTV